MTTSNIPFFLVFNYVCSQSSSNGICVRDTPNPNWEQRSVSNTKRVLKSDRSFDSLLMMPFNGYFPYFIECFIFASQTLPNYVKLNANESRLDYCPSAYLLYVVHFIFATQIFPSFFKNNQRSYVTLNFLDLIFTGYFLVCSNSTANTSLVLP